PLPGCQHTQWHSDAHRDDQRKQHERQRRFHALHNERADRPSTQYRRAKIATDNVEHPLAKADMDGLIQPQLATDTLDNLGRGLVAGNNQRRIAGRNIKKTEDEDSDDQHHRDGCQTSTNNVTDHRTSISRWAVVGGAAHHEQPWGKTWQQTTLLPCCGLDAADAMEFGKARME